LPNRGVSVSSGVLGPVLAGPEINSGLRRRFFGLGAYGLTPVGLGTSDYHPSSAIWLVSGGPVAQSALWPVRCWRLRTPWAGSAGPLFADGDAFLSFQARSVPRWSISTHLAHPLPRTPVLPPERPALICFPSPPVPICPSASPDLAGLVGHFRRPILPDTRLGPAKMRRGARITSLQLAAGVVGIDVFRTRFPPSAAQPVPGRNCRRPVRRRFCVLPMLATDSVLVQPSRSLVLHHVPAWRRRLARSGRPIGNWALNLKFRNCLRFLKSVPRAVSGDLTDVRHHWIIRYNAPGRHLVICVNTRDRALARQKQGACPSGPPLQLLRRRLRGQWVSGCQSPRQIFRAASRPRMMFRYPMSRRGGVQTR